MDLQDKVAFVTGASSGIGAATARALAAEGVKVGLAARRRDKLDAVVAEIEQAGGTGVALELDVTDEAACKAAADALIARFGGIDILVNNAGLMPLSNIDKFKTDEWHRMVDVNVKGLFNSTAAVLPHMIEKKSGHVVNMSSIAGRKTFKGLSVYCATKAAIAAFSDAMRMEIGPDYNIRVTNVQPGAVATELYDHITDPDYIKQMKELEGSMTFLEGADIAATIVFALKAPPRMDVAEVFVMPTQQGW